MEWVISLITGAVGGNIAGAVFKNLSLGTLGNTIAGVVGGGAGSAILNAVLGSAARPVAPSSATSPLPALAAWS